MNNLGLEDDWGLDFDQNLALFPAATFQTLSLPSPLSALRKLLFLMTGEPSSSMVI